MFQLASVGGHWKKMLLTTINPTLEECSSPVAGITFTGGGLGYPWDCHDSRGRCWMVTTGDIWNTPGLTTAQAGNPSSFPHEKNSVLHKMSSRVTFGEAGEADIDNQMRPGIVTSIKNCMQTSSKGARSKYLKRLKRLPIQGGFSKMSLANPSS